MKKQSNYFFALLISFPLLLGSCVGVNYGDVGCCGDGVLLPLVGDNSDNEYISFKVNGVSYIVNPGNEYDDLLQLVGGIRWEVYCGGTDGNGSGIGFQFPLSVYSGAHYTESSLCCMDLAYYVLMSGESETRFVVSQVLGFDLTVIEWGGVGGRARGTFSGKLYSSSTCGELTLTDGVFDFIIH